MYPVVLAVIHKVVSDVDIALFSRFHSASLDFLTKPQEENVIAILFRTHVFFL